MLEKGQKVLAVLKKGGKRIGYIYGPSKFAGKYQVKVQGIKKVLHILETDLTVL